MVFGLVFPAICFISYAIFSFANDGFVDTGTETQFRIKVFPRRLFAPPFSLIGRLETAILVLGLRTQKWGGSADNNVCGIKYGLPVDG